MNAFTLLFTLLALALTFVQASPVPGPPKKCDNAGVWAAVNDQLKDFPCTLAAYNAAFNDQNACKSCNLPTLGNVLSPTVRYCPKSETSVLQGRVGQLTGALGRACRNLAAQSRVPNIMNPLFILTAFLLALTNTAAATPLPAPGQLCNSDEVYTAATSRLGTYPCIFRTFQDAYVGRNYCEACNLGALIGAIAPSLQTRPQCATELNALLFGGQVVILQETLKSACGNGWSE
ncbi:hypothetical protein HDU67_005009 [Dinochytrium kinnereticum]|nr:hypothetical protein HDU67_005009 [Dinochytrium kinnereticum]